MEQPPPKRARVADDRAVVSANEAVSFVLVDHDVSSAGSLASFQPEFSHQLFGDDEEIKGYVDLKVTVYLHPVSFTAYVEIGYPPEPGLSELQNRMQTRAKNTGVSRC